VSRSERTSPRVGSTGSDATGAQLNAHDAERLERCLHGGGVAVFPADTVYGLCCNPDDPAAVSRLYQLKGRPPQRPSAVMFFDLELAIESLSELTWETEVLRALLPGPLTLLLANPLSRFPAACGPDPATLGLRVPLLGSAIAALRAVSLPLMQSSANLSGQPDVRRLADVPSSIRHRADLVLDGGELPGRASTVLDLRQYAATGAWRVLREGALSHAELQRRLAGVIRPQHPRSC
jgi:L-threonylcarbamoyladenylate synthase